MKSGRNFSAQYPTDSTAVIINETAAKLYVGADPVNKKIYEINDLSTGKLVEYNIIGVIKDFNFNSLRDQVAPLVLKLQQDDRGMAVRISTHDIPAVSYTHLDVYKRQLYTKTEARAGCQGTSWAKILQTAYEKRKTK